MAIITPAQVREHFPSLVGTGEDTLLTTLIGRANALMAAYCSFPFPDAGGRTLEAATYTCYLGRPALDPRVLDLPIAPVISVTSVHIDAGLDFDADSLIDAADYVLVGPVGQIYLPAASSSAWSVEPRANKVVVSAGWATAPADLVALAATAVRHLIDGAHVGAEVLSVSAGGQSQTRQAAASLLPPVVRAGLDAGYTLWRNRVG